MREERVEIAVVGSGPGGVTAACVLAEAGREVLVLEEGPEIPPGTIPTYSRGEMVTCYRNAGLTVALGSPKVAYVEGRCVGGGSEVNGGLYHRTPDAVLNEWARDFGLLGAQPAQLAPHFEVVEADLGVTREAGEPAPSSLRLAAGAEALGWSVVEVPRWFREGPDGVPLRQSMSRTLIPRLRAAGGRVRAEARVQRLRRRGSEWWLQVAAGLVVRAEHVFVAGGAIQTPLLLRRSGLAPRAGRRLGLQSMTKVVARFAEPVTLPGSGIPVHQVKERGPRIGLGGSIATPEHVSLALIDHPDELPRAHAEPERYAIYYAVIRGGSGSVRPLPGFRDPLVRYQLAERDLADLALGQRDLCQVLLAGGAEAVFPCWSGAPVVRGVEDLARLPATLPRGKANLFSVHLTSSCPMGEGAACVTDSYGRVRGCEGLYVSDASLLCDPPGVNPQGSVMAFARRNAQRFLEAQA